MKPSRHILPIIVLAQFCCTSLWFAGNGVIDELIASFGLTGSALGHLTSSIQFGFISGTLTYALLTVADRFSPSKVFFLSALAGALINLLMCWDNNTLYSLLILRFLTGFFLAGIYPVGMKIAADYYREKLGRSLGLLVGALVLGTALPHLIKGSYYGLAWKGVVAGTSILATAGGLLIFVLVPDGPFRKAGRRIKLSSVSGVFKNPGFRAAAFGYFGHMWELYAFWTFVPVMLATYNGLYPAAGLNVPLWSFAIIGIGSIGCVLGGHFSLSLGTRRVAAGALFLSGACCVLSPLLFKTEAAYVFLFFLLFWGIMVITDSPLFSTMVANNAPAEKKGTALTIVNCIGFSITIISIQLVSLLWNNTDPTYIYMVLGIGPLLAMLFLLKNKPV